MNLSSQSRASRAKHRSAEKRNKSDQCAMSSIFSCPGLKWQVETLCGALVRSTGRDSRRPRHQLAGAPPRLGGVRGRTGIQTSRIAVNWRRFATFASANGYDTRAIEAQ